jgi:hypothetical protein
MASRAWKHIFRFEPISNLVLNDDRMEPMIGRPTRRFARTTAAARASVIGWLPPSEPAIQESDEPSNRLVRRPGEVASSIFLRLYKVKNRARVDGLRPQGDTCARQQHRKAQE